MKARNYSFILLVTLFFSGCVVYSFYPLYTEKDLFENDLLTGEWFENDNEEVSFTEGESVWKFEHPWKGNKKNREKDKTRYVLTLTTTHEEEVKQSQFSVHIIKLGGAYFLDFYLEEFLDDDNISLASFHVVPVHTFARVQISEDRLQINWFDPEWLEDLIKENRIRIHHENNNDFILLTAKPRELQKFVSKYVNSDIAFKDGLSVELHRKR